MAWKANGTSFWATFHKLEATLGWWPVVLGYLAFLVGFWLQKAVVSSAKVPLLQIWKFPHEKGVCIYIYIYIIYVYIHVYHRRNGTKHRNILVPRSSLLRRGGRENHAWHSAGSSPGPGSCSAGPLWRLRPRMDRLTDTYIHNCCGVYVMCVHVPVLIYRYTY